MFLRTDTHWTPEGAEVAANAAGENHRRQVPAQRRAAALCHRSRADEGPHKGDLRLFLPLDPLFENLMPPQEPLQNAQHRGRRVSSQAGTTPCSPTTRYRSHLVGTSYSANPNWNFVGALKQALHSDVVNYAEDGHGPILPMLKLPAKRRLQEQPAAGADLGVPGTLSAR